MPKKKVFEYLGPLGSDAVGINVSRCFGDLGVFRGSVVSVDMTGRRPLYTVEYEVVLTLNPNLDPNAQP